MITAFAFEIVPGSDETLGFCLTLEQAKAEAEEHRQDIERANAEDGGAEVVPAVSIYEVQLADPTIDQLLPVLNERLALTDALVQKTKVVATVE